MKRIACISALLISLCLNAQDAIHNAGNIHIHNGGEIAIFGNVSNSGVWNSNSGTIRMVGTALQEIDGPATIATGELVIDNSNGVNIETIIRVLGQLDLTDGVVYTDRSQPNVHHIHLDAGATHVNASDQSHIDGFIRKTGNTAFAFPVGDDGQIQMLSITAPANPNSIFEGSYYEVDPVNVSNTAAHDPSIVHVSDCEFWSLKAVSAPSVVSPKLHFDSHSCGTASPSDLRVAYWDGSSWKDQGQTNISGTPIAGDIQGNALSPDGLLTLSTSEFTNVLPVELLFFTANAVNDQVWLRWKTSTELNNSHFEVERSTSAENWEFVGRIEGAGTSYNAIDYALLDKEPHVGMSFYRLKQVDHDGQFTYSNVETVFFAPKIASAVYPNPASDLLHIQFNAQGGTPEFRLLDAAGRSISINPMNTTGALFDLDVTDLAPGTYFLQVSVADHRKVHEVLIH